MKRCLVTGGAGFIGSHLVDRLAAEGHEVIAIDNLVTGRRENLATAERSKRVKFVNADVGNFDAIKPAFDGVDWVFHLAALADIVPSMQKPLDYLHSNVVGTTNVVEAARLAGVSRFVYTASSSCYGIPDVYPTPETAEAKPQYPYALTKYLGEQTVLHWAQVYKLPSISLRLFNVYGPRSRTTGAYGAVFGVFLAQKLAGRPFTVVGDGTQTRDFTFVSDVVDAFVKAAQSNHTGRVYNVGSSGTYSVNRLVELIGGPKTYIPKRPGEPDCTFAETSRIHEELGWKPIVSFEDGVKQMLASIENWRSAPVWDPESIATATQAWFAYLS
ncbi:MAG TPA: SDR family oxidoreductase [Pirellulales bacterium]|jgi:UDP-glucose 4-epimerase|nr:SDR family oxidoreductase [Pirellulales bacterium]